MDLSFDGFEDEPRSEYDYFIQFYSGKFYNIVRVQTDETVGEAVERYRKACRAFRYIGVKTERKDLSTLLQKALSGHTPRRNEDKDTDIDILKGKNRFDY